MAHVRKRKLSEEPVPVVSLADLRKFLATCKEGTFEDRRDTAIIRVLVDTGARLEEIANLQMEDVVIERARRELYVTGKGRVSRWVRYPRLTAALVTSRACR
jgi:integrase